MRMRSLQKVVREKTRFVTDSFYSFRLLVISCSLDLCKAAARPAHESQGMLDVYRTKIARLKDRGELDEEITEDSNMDWRAERNPLKEYLALLSLQSSYIPRAGELVLWVPSLEGELSWRKGKGRIQQYSQKQSRWLGMPDWRAGVICQVPEEQVLLRDLVKTTPKKKSVNYSGFRIETFPDPSSRDEGCSSHYKYVPLKCIKPFNAWELFLADVDREKFHRSIEYALTVMSSFSLFNKFHFKGTWPNASIYSRGIFIGAELLVVGDAVRLKAEGYSVDYGARSRVTDIMVIESIRIKLTNCVDDARSDQLAAKYAVRIQGSVYTTSLGRALGTAARDKRAPPKPMSHDEVVSAFQYVGMGAFGNWYPVHDKVQVSPDMILGRCYEYEAMEYLFDSHRFDLDLHSVENARNYSSQVDKRIPEGKAWFWGDFRTQTLAINSLNGQDVRYSRETRDGTLWSNCLRLIDRPSSTVDPAPELDRRPHKSHSNFRKLNKTSSLVSRGLGTSGPVDPSEKTKNEYVDTEDESEEYGRGETEETASGERPRKSKKIKRKR